MSRETPKRDRFRGGAWAPSSLQRRTIARQRGADSFNAADGTSASMQVLSNSLLGSGLEQLLKGKLGFFNFTCELLVSDIARTLPSKSMVIEIRNRSFPTRPLLRPARN